MADSEREQGPGQTGGMSRRDMLRRSAIVGGTMVWATPVVQSMGPAAFAQTGGSPPPPTGECVYYAVAFDVNGGCQDIAGSGAPGNTGCISANPNFASAQGGGCGFVVSATFSGVSGDEAESATVQLAAEAQDIAGFSKCGDVGCQPATVSGTTLNFTKCQGTGPTGQEQGISNVQVLFCIPTSEPT